MRCFFVRLVLLFLAVSWLTLVTACSKSPRAGLDDIDRMGPQEKLDRVVDRLRRQYQGSDDILSMANEDGTMQRVQVRNVVNNISTHLHEPKSPEQNYTAEIAIRTSTYFTLLSQDRARAEDDPYGDNPDEGDSSAPPEIDRLPGKQSKTPNPLSAEITESILGKSSEDHVVTCDLEYEDGDWVLKSANLPDSLALAMAYALDAPGSEKKPVDVTPFTRDRAGELGFPERNFGND